MIATTIEVTTNIMICWLIYKNSCKEDIIRQISDIRSKSYELELQLGRIERASSTTSTESLMRDTRTRKELDDFKKEVHDKLEAKQVTAQCPALEATKCVDSKDKNDIIKESDNMNHGVRKQNKS